MTNALKTSALALAALVGLGAVAPAMASDGQLFDSSYYITQLRYDGVNAIAADQVTDSVFRATVALPNGQQAFEFLRRTVAACKEHKLIRDVDVDATAQSLWMAVHGLVALLISDKSFPFVGHQRLIDQLMSTLMRGLQP